LAEERKHSQPLIISLGLILLLFIIAFGLAIPFFIIRSHKASELFECLFHFPAVLIYVVNTFWCVNIMLQVKLCSWYFRMLSSLLLTSIGNLTRQNLCAMF